MIQMEGTLDCFQAISADVGDQRRIGDNKIAGDGLHIADVDVVGRSGSYGNATREGRARRKSRCVTRILDGCCAGGTARCCYKENESVLWFYDKSLL